MFGFHWPKRPKLGEEGTCRTGKDVRKKVTATTYCNRTNRSRISGVDFSDVFERRPTSRPCRFPSYPAAPFPQECNGQPAVLDSERHCCTAQQTSELRVINQKSGLFCHTSFLQGTLSKRDLFSSIRWSPSRDHPMVVL